MSGPPLFDASQRLSLVGHLYKNACHVSNMGASFFSRGIPILVATNREFGILYTPKVNIRPTPSSSFIRSSVLLLLTRGIGLSLPLCFDDAPFVSFLSVYHNSCYTAIMSSATTVNQLKESLVKELPAESDEAVERCKDILERLQEQRVSLEILSETMIGKTVSQLKTHEALGSTAKALVKKWKQVAKQQQGTPTTAATTTSGADTATKAPPPPAAKAERRESLNNEPPEDFAAELIPLSPIRQNICKKYFEIFQTAKDALVQSGINEEAIGHLLGPRALEVEAAIQNAHGGDKKSYTDKARSLAFNLKKNAGLTQEIILGQLDAESLISMKTEELASDEMRAKRNEEAKKLIDSKRLDWDQANEEKINKMCGIKGDLLKASLFTCGRCKSTKTTSTQKQTRSADEPMTVFVLCLNCGKRWKC